MKIRRSANPFTVYTDMLLCLFIWAITISFLMMVVAHVQAKKDEDFHPKAEYLVTLFWDDNRNVDLDLWLKTPISDSPVYYGNREVENVGLDRDSRGLLTNRKELSNGMIAVSANREIIAVRAIMPGDYIVGVTYYDGTSLDSNYHYPVGTPTAEGKITATVQVDKVNPVFTSEFNKTIELDTVKQVKVVVAFHVAEDGQVTILPKPADDAILPHGIYGGFSR